MPVWLTGGASGSGDLITDVKLVGEQQQAERWAGLKVPVT